MIRVLQYAAQVKDFRGRVTGLPGWALILMFLAALPGIILIALSFLAFLVSLLALLLLTAPLYRLLKLLVGSQGEGLNKAAWAREDAVPRTEFATLFGSPSGPPGRRRVDATVSDAPVEPGAVKPD